MEAWKTKRGEWTKARDNPPFKIGKGAVSGVNVGSRIEAVYDSAKKGYAPLAAAVAKLKTDLETYSVKIKKMAKPGDKATEKFAKFADWIKANLLKDVLELEKDVAADLAIVDKILPDRKAVAAESFSYAELIPSEVHARINSLRQWYEGQIKNEKVPPEKKPKPEDMTDEALYKRSLELENYTKKVTHSATQLDKHAANFKTYKFKTLLPGFETHYKNLKEWGADCEEASKGLGKCAAAKSIMDLHAAWKPTASKLEDCYVQLTTGLNEAVAKLRGK